MKVGFKMVADTKNTRRFQEATHDGKPVKEGNEVIGSLYVKKEAAGGREEITISFPMPDAAKGAKSDE